MLPKNVLGNGVIVLCAALASPLPVTDNIRQERRCGGVGGGVYSSSLFQWTAFCI